MKAIDVIFALISGRIIGVLLNDFFKEWSISIGWYYHLILWLALPFISLFCLWLAWLIGKKFIFVFQAAKFLLVGAVFMVVDLKLFEFLVLFKNLLFVKSDILFFSLLFLTSPLTAKGISFLIATFLKFWGNKYWVFGRPEKDNLKKELVKFFSITLVGMVIDVTAFYYFVNILGPQFGTSVFVWIKLSVILAGVIVALWNFLGYKFLVFKI